MTRGDRRGHLPYYFGLYHWRERGRRIVLGVVTIAAGVLAARRRGRLAGALGAIAALWGVSTAGSPVRALASPPPWVLDREKYEALAAELQISNADRLLDIGCGTGRSLVGLAPVVSESCSVIGLDTFDDRIILGNGGQLAERNARIAGLDAAALRGDATRLPVDGGTVDIVTMCRLLHDLPADAADRALEEAYRVCAPDGHVGVLALPYPHDEDADPATYWRTAVSTAGFDVETVRERDDGYTIVVGAVGNGS